MELIKDHLSTKPEIPLDKPEQFLFDLSEISNFAERISCFMFEAEFDDSISTIEHTLTNIKTTCEVMYFCSRIRVQGVKLNNGTIRRPVNIKNVNHFHMYKMSFNLSSALYRISF